MLQDRWHCRLSLSLFTGRQFHFTAARALFDSSSIAIPFAALSSAHVCGSHHHQHYHRHCPPQQVVSPLLPPLLSSLSPECTKCVWNLTSIVAATAAAAAVPHFPAHTHTSPAISRIGTHASLSLSLSLARFLSAGGAYLSADTAAAAAANTVRVDSKN